MSRIVLLTGLLLATLCCATPVMAGGWLIYHDGPYQGYVLDDETGKPIEGAAVVAEWWMEIFFPAGVGGYPFFDVNEAVTDEDGRFSLESKTGIYWWPFANLSNPRFVIYKPGYDSYPSRLYERSKLEYHDNSSNDYRKVFENRILLSNDNKIYLKKASTKSERMHVLSGVNAFIRNEFDQKKIRKISESIKTERILLRLD